MLAKLARIILAFSTFPLIGAYGLRWVGAFVGQMVSATGMTLPPLLALDLIGAIVGLALGIILAVQIVGCSFQPEASPVRGPGDVILIILTLVLLGDVALAKVGAGAEWLRWLPAASLVIWAGCAAATASLHRTRQTRRIVHIIPPTEPPPGPAGPPAYP